ncbi:MAG TPA: hypothetical protein VEV45_21035 [Streptosporangiaceae bacterium]|nr:hypothetical protein [Streptosporangiaceae bacterium]
MTRIRLIAAIICALAFPLLGFTAASAKPMPNAPTLACALTDPFCNEPVFAQSALSSHDFTPTDDAAMTIAGLNVVASPNAAADDGSQDFSFNQADVVPTPGNVGAFNYDNYTKVHYHGDGVWFEEWTPFGQDTGLCLQKTSLNRIVLRVCDGGADQAFIVTRNVPFLTPPASPLYSYALSVLPAINAQHHLCLTGPASLVGPITTTRCIRHSPTVATGQMWAALP